MHDKEPAPMPDAASPGRPKYDLGRLDDFPELTPDLLRLAYHEACLARLHVERVVQECLLSASRHP